RNHGVFRALAASLGVATVLVFAVACGGTATPTPTTAPAATASPTPSASPTPTEAPTPTPAPSPSPMAPRPTPTMAHGGMGQGMATATPSVANEFREGPIVVRNVWARAATQGDGVSAVYMVIENTGDQPDRLLHAHCDAAQTVELHESRMENGVMKMQPVEGIDLPPHGTIELKPGGLHVMMIGLTRDLNPGDTLELELHFEQAGHVTVEAVVQKP
ncbi:MAG: copper chaperone PCu(A)C, partial [Thermomicrobium sp.]|nr:copper chaperone PCu(A)C [Thermomicrobium sp.]